MGGDIILLAAVIIGYVLGRQDLIAWREQAQKIKRKEQQMTKMPVELKVPARTGKFHEPPKETQNL